MNAMLTQISEGSVHTGILIAVLLAGLVGLLAGATWLVHGAVQMARVLRIPPLLVGLSIVAFGTSAPELGLNVIAAIKGSTDLAFGNVVGSNVANIGLVLGLSALIVPLRVRSRLVRIELPLLTLVTVGLITMAVVGPMKDGEYGITRIDGIILVMGFAGFCWMWLGAARRHPEDAAASDEIDGKEAKGVLTSGLLLLGGLVLLICGGWATEAAAVGAARQAGVSEAIIGLTIVAVATSLPEVFTSLVACVKGNVDLAVGTVVGSNLFNILLVLGMTSIIAPVGVPPGLGWTGLIGMTVLTIALIPICVTGNRRVSRWEGGGLLLAYGAIIVLSLLS